MSEVIDLSAPDAGLSGSGKGSRKPQRRKSGKRRPAREIPPAAQIAALGLIIAVALGVVIHHFGSGPGTPEMADANSTITHVGRAPASGAASAPAPSATRQPGAYEPRASSRAVGITEGSTMPARPAQAEGIH